MHDYFQTSGWFVPTNPAPRISGNDVEERMRRHEIQAGQMEERFNDPSLGKNGVSSQEELEKARAAA